MKNKAKYMALKDLLDGVLKSSLLSGLDIKKEEPKELKELTKMPDVVEEDMDEDETPKAVEISITRLADLSKQLPKKETKKAKRK